MKKHITLMLLPFTLAILIISYKLTPNDNKHIFSIDLKKVDRISITQMPPGEVKYVNKASYIKDIVSNLNNLEGIKTSNEYVNGCSYTIHIYGSKQYDINIQDSSIGYNGDAFAINSIFSQYIEKIFYTKY